MTHRLPNYCDEDGAELTTEENGLAAKATCPDCGERWYGTLVSTLLWKCPPSMRNHVENALRWWFDRPCVTPGLSMLRTFVLVAVVAFVGSKLSGILGVAGLISALGMFLVGVEATNIAANDSADGARLTWHDLVVGGLGAAVAVAALDPTLTLPTLALPDLPALADLVKGGAYILVAFVGFHVAYSVMTPVHERLHWLAFRAIGVEARVEYDYWRIGGVPVGIPRAETVPRPASWTGSEWEHLVTGLAPALILVPVAVVWVLLPPGTIDALPTFVGGAVLGAGIGVVLCGFPSAGDFGVITTGRYRQYTQAAQARTHRAAEGLEGLA